MDRLVFHVDVNSAFLSWEAARRVFQGQEDIRLIPSAVGGDKDKRTGIILAKSIPAKKYGIKTGEPVSMALRKYPQLMLVRPDFALYNTCSAAFMDICRSYAPVVEPASIDECFMDMSGTSHMYPDPVALACELKDRIRESLGFTVNVGISRNKLLAKMASDFKKPDLVHTLFPEEIEEKFWPLPVESLLFVGEATAEKLRCAGISRIGQLACCPLEQCQQLLGQKSGLLLHNYALGIDPSPVQAQREKAKGFSVATTLEKDLCSREEARLVLLALADDVSARMRRECVQAGCVCLSLRSNEFKTRSHQRKLGRLTDVSMDIYNVALELFDELWDKRSPLRLLGISLTELSGDGAEQLSLFDTGDSFQRERQLDKTMDAIRDKFGSNTIMRGSTLQSSGRVGRMHKAKQDFKIAQRNKEETKT